MKQLLTLSSLFLLVSCATELDFKMPINHMMIPENTGKTLNFSGQVKYVGSQKVKLASVASSLFSSTAIVDEEQSIDRSRGLGLLAEVGLHDKIDVYYSDSSDASRTFGLKFQVLGKPYYDRQEKDISVAIAAGYGGTNSDAAAITTSDNAAYITELDLSTYEFMLLGGYRVNKQLLGYVNLFKSVHNVKANLKQNGIATKFINGDSTMTGFNIGAHLSNDEGNLFGMVELGYGYGRYENNLKDHAFTYAFSFGVAKF